jgi:CRISPR-associated protein Cas8b1/Cst1 subtype I-B
MSIINNIIYHCFIFGVAFNMNFADDASDIYFVDAPLPLEELYHMNINYQNMLKGVSLENPSGHYIINQLEVKQREARFTLQGLNLIHLSSRGIISSSHHTVINFAKAKVLKESFTELSRIPYFVRDQWIELVIQNRPVDHFFYQLLRQCLKDLKETDFQKRTYKTDLLLIDILRGIQILVRLTKRIQCLQNQEDTMEEIETRLEHMRRAGYFLRNAMQGKEADTSSGFTSQAHKILNTIRLHDYETFTNHILRLCLIYNQPAHTISQFLQAKEEEKPALAQSFMSSFLSPIYKKAEDVAVGGEVNA